MGKRNGKVNIALFAAAVLLCLTLFTTHLTSGLYARYTTEASSSDSARVAKWDIQLDAKPRETLTFAGNMDTAYTEVLTHAFSVSSDSEVAAKYSLTVNFSQKLDESITLTLDEITGTANTDRTSFTFTSDNWTFDPGKTTTDHTLTLTRVYFQNNQMPEAFSGVQVTISVLAEQID